MSILIVNFYSALYFCTIYINNCISTLNKSKYHKHIFTEIILFELLHTHLDVRILIKIDSQ